MKRFTLALCLVLTSCAAQTNASLHTKSPRTTGQARTALVSYYSCCGRTASGEKFNSRGFTVANKTLPFGTWVLFTNEANMRTARARVNDRGPYIKGRDFDVSRGVAQWLGFERQGTAHLRWEIVK